MTTRSSSSSASVVLAIILILTFPIWLGIGAGIFGLIVGILGAVFGIVTGIFGVLIGIFLLPFKILFGHGSWFPHFHMSAFIVAMIVIAIALIVRKNG